MPSTSYRYELRRGQKLIATGHISVETPLQVGDQITLGKQTGIVRELEPQLTTLEARLVLDLLDSHH